MFIGVNLGCAHHLAGYRGARPRRLVNHQRERHRASPRRSLPFDDNCHSPALLNSLVATFLRDTAVRLMLTPTGSRPSSVSKNHHNPSDDKYERDRLR